MVELNQIQGDELAIKLLFALAVVLVIALYFLRKKGQAEADRAEPAERIAAKTSPYHAVSISFDKYACPAAKEMAGRRFLSTAAPKLPLPECSALQCNCTFKHHGDRRSGKDRRSPFSPAGVSSATGTFKQEQRQGSDRRKSADPDDFF